MEVARIDIVSDAICPWCYIGKRHLEGALAILAREGLSFDVAWRPFQLNPEMPAAGAARAEYRAKKFGSAARAAELDANITATAAKAGLAFRTDLMTRTPNTISAHRLAAYAMTLGPGVQDRVIEAMFSAYFVEGRDIGDLATLADIAADAGIERNEALRCLDGSQGSDEIRAEELSYRRAGLSGVPTFIMRNYVLFSGAMSAEAMADAFRSARAVLSKQAA